MKPIETHAERDDNIRNVIGCARDLEDASRNLCRATLTRPYLTPADVDTVLAHLAAAAAALPQAIYQLSDILDGARNLQTLVMDGLADTEDPDLAIGTARLHLDAAGEPGMTLHRYLDAAHQVTAHIATVNDPFTDGQQAMGPEVQAAARRHEPRRPRLQADSREPETGMQR